jgi:hypothetical protein
MYDRDTQTYKFTLVYYSQFKDGIPVFRADLRLLVRNQPGYPLVLASSGLRDLGDFTLMMDPAQIPDAVGHAEALVEIPGLTNFRERNVVIWAGLDDMQVEPALAAAFIGENASPEKWLFIADAGTGKILYKENLIIEAEVTGNISGYATPGNSADFCVDEVPMPMPWATARIQGDTDYYADANGDYVIPDAGTSSVTVESPMYGQYFVVNDYLDSEEILTESVTPPGQVDFLHNAANDSEYVRAQVNAYVQANIVRNFVLTYVPNYPVIESETGFPVWVNRTDKYCPGNAWYDYESINFCATGDVYPNTAFSVVVHHEYGHHIIYCGGSGQGQYGEGMADTIGLLITDDPILGYGFKGDCNAGLRSADNNYWLSGHSLLPNH